MTTVAASALGVMAVLVWGPRGLAQLASDWDELSPGDRADAEAAARTALVQAVAGTAAAIGLIFTARQVRERRTQQSADLFLKAVEKLSASDPTSRLYAIHSLERVADLSPADRSSVERILAEVVRAGPSPAVPTQPVHRVVPSSPVPPLTARLRQGALEAVGRLLERIRPSPYPVGDVLIAKTMAPALRDRVYQAAIEALGSRRRRPRKEPLVLEGIVFDQPHIDALVFDRCCLRNASFYDGHINGTSFRLSSLHNATVTGEIAGTDFRGADLRGATIRSLQAIAAPTVDGTEDAQATERFTRGIRFEGALYNRSTVERMQPASLSRRLEEQGILVEHEEPVIPGCR